MTDQQAYRLSATLVGVVAGTAALVGYIVVVGNRLSETRGYVALVLAAIIGMCYAYVRAAWKAPRPSDV